MFFYHVVWVHMHLTQIHASQFLTYLQYGFKKKEERGSFYGENPEAVGEWIGK